MRGGVFLREAHKRGVCMIAKDDLLKAVASNGYITYDDIREGFVNGTSEEVVEMTLKALMEQGSLKRVKCQAQDKITVLYYIPV